MVFTLYRFLKTRRKCNPEMKHRELSPQKWQVNFMVWRNLSKWSGNKKWRRALDFKGGGGTIEKGTPRRNMLIYEILKNDVNCWIKWKFTFEEEWSSPPGSNRQVIWTKLTKSHIYLVALLLPTITTTAKSPGCPWNPTSCNLRNPFAIVGEEPSWLIDAHLRPTCSEFKCMTKGACNFQQQTVQICAHLPRVGNIQLVG